MIVVVRYVWIVVAACGFSQGAIPSDSGGTGDGGDATDAMADARPDAGPCAAVGISASGAHTCAIRSDASVWCWGKNGQGEIAVPPLSSGQCFVSPVTHACVTSPRRVTLADPVVALGMGDQHSCALTASKTFCWGANDGGQFGNGPTGDAYVATEIPLRAGATKIAGGASATCSLHTGGQVRCSGFNTLGEVGNNTRVPQYTPVIVHNTATVISMSLYNACDVVNGAGFCWGDDTYGQIDTNTTLQHNVPHAVTAAGECVDIASAGHHTCIRPANKTVSCWGRNSEGQVGNGATATYQSRALFMQTEIEQVAAGGRQTCVRRTNGEVFCAGEGYGASPILIALPAPALEITAADGHACAIVDDGGVWCWGDNRYGNVGNGTTSPFTRTPAQAQIPCT
jgi:alpha-tubulin suppressor-like RCC1 family protein